MNVQNECHNANGVRAKQLLPVTRLQTLLDKYNCSLTFFYFFKKKKKTLVKLTDAI